MSKKKAENTEAEKNSGDNSEITPIAEETKSVKLEPVTVVIKREHCLTPHSIELRKNKDGIVIDARTEDWQHIYTIGAKTVEQILAETGVAVPDSDETELVIKFSPANGEVISVEPKVAEIAEVVETAKSTENKDGDESTEPNAQ